RTGFMDTMMEMGARIDYEDREAVAGDSSATIVVRKSRLRDCVVSGDRIPAMSDELPLLACVAAAAGVTVEVRDAEELRVKESDRISTVARNLRAVGVTVDEFQDGFAIRGQKKKLAGKV